MNRGKLRTSLLALGLILLSGVSSVFAETKGKIPAWMGDSSIFLSEVVYGKSMTINDLYGKKPLATTNTEIASSDDILVISNEYAEYGIVGMKVTTTFVMDQDGACYPAELVFEVPSTLQSETFTCDGGPLNDPENYGAILGTLSQLLNIFYEQ